MMAKPSHLYASRSVWESARDSSQGIRISTCGRVHLDRGLHFCCWVRWRRRCCQHLESADVDRLTWTESTAIKLTDRDTAPISISDHHARSLAVALRDTAPISISDQHAPSLAIAHRDAPSLTITDQDPHPIAVTKRACRSVSYRYLCV